MKESEELNFFRISRVILTFTDTLFDQLGTDPVKGLTRYKAQELLEYYGYNTLTPATQYGWTLVLFKSMCTGNCSLQLHIFI